MPHPSRLEGIKGAIELVTAWLDSPDGPPPLMVNTLRRRMDEHPSGDRVIGAVEVVMGLTHLCGYLLVLREFENGVTCQETIQKLAAEFARVTEFELDLGLFDFNDGD
jgi:hypothetical protein